MRIKLNRACIFMLSFIMILFLSGCGNTDNNTEKESDVKVVLEEYNEISDRLMEFSSVQAKLSTSFFVNNGSESLQLNMLSDIKQTRNEEKGLNIEMITSTRYLDEAIEIASYYADGYFYTEYDGRKIKYKLPYERMIKDNNLSLPHISQDNIKEGLKEIDDRGNTVITLVADSQIIKDELDKYISLLMDSSSEYFDCSDLTIVVIADEEGNIVSCDMVLSVMITEQGIKTEYTIDTYGEYFKINEDIEIAFPDFSAYSEIVDVIDK